jgi:hypothetical protein
MIDITGEKYNKLTALTYLGKSKWRCICDCGNTAIISSYAIINGRTKSCGCIRKEVAKNLNLKKWGESSFTGIYCSYRKGASNRGLTFNLSIDELRNLVVKPCRYCGALPGNEKKSRFNNGSYYYNGIDRINNNIGYELTNVVPCCWRCNEAKKSTDYKEFISWIRRTYQHTIDIKL